MQQDYERINEELNNQVKKNEELSRDLWNNIDSRKKLEGELRSLEADMSLYKSNLSEQDAHALREIGILKSQVNDLKYQRDDLMKQIKYKNDETHQLNQEIFSWKEVVERLNKENTELKEII